MKSDVNDKFYAHLNLMYELYNDSAAALFNAKNTHRRHARIFLENVLSEYPAVGQCIYAKNNTINVFIQENQRVRPDVYFEFSKEQYETPDTIDLEVLDTVVMMIRHRLETEYNVIL